MKTCLPITILLALVLATSASAAQVGSIRLAHENGATVAHIDVQGPFQFTHTAEVPKDGKPDRLIVDIIGASHTWGPKEWSALPQCSISKLRIGQYSSKPEKVVRVVFELGKAPVYQADSDGKSITIRLTDNSVKPFAAWTSGPAPAAAPVVAPVTPPAVASNQPAVKPTAPAVTPKPVVATQSNAPVVASAPKVESKPVDKTVASHNALAQQPAAKPTQPAAQSNAPTVTAPKSPTQDSKPVVAQQPAVKPAPVVASNQQMKVAPVATAAPAPTKSAPVVAANDQKQATVTTPTPATKPAVVAPKVEAKPAPVVAANDSKPAVTTPAPATKPAVVAPKVEVQPASVVASNDTKPAVTTPAPATKPAEVAPKVEVKPTPVVASQPSPEVSATKPVTPSVAQVAPKVEAKSGAPEVKAPAPVVAAKPDQLVKAEQFKPTAPTTPVEKAVTPTVPAVKPNTPVVASSDDEVDDKVANTPAEAKPVVNADQPKVESGDTKVNAPVKPLLAEADDATGIATPARQTARFRRSTTASAKMKSSLVAEFPQRLVIKYENMGYRDPFATLIDDTRTYDTPIEKRLANVEGLRLVGILENATGDNRALFQDKRNFSFMLKAGDKVEKGYVLRVENDKVYFQIFEYGWSRTVALTFDNRD